MPPRRNPAADNAAVVRSHPQFVSTHCRSRTSRAGRPDISSDPGSASSVMSRFVPPHSGHGPRATGRCAPQAAQVASAFPPVTSEPPSSRAAHHPRTTSVDRSRRGRSPRGGSAPARPALGVWGALFRRPEGRHREADSPERGRGRSGDRGGRAVLEEESSETRGCAKS